MKRQEGGRIWVPGQPHWALLRAVWKDACFFLLVTMRCHTDLSCPYGNQLGKSLVCLCTEGNASFSINSPDDVVLQDSAGGSVVSDPPLATLCLAGTPDREWSLHPAPSETPKHHHAGGGDGNSHWALSGDGVGQSKRMESFQELSLVPRPKTYRVLEGKVFCCLETW